MTDRGDRFDAEFAELVTAHLLRLGCSPAEVHQARATGFLAVLAMVPSSMEGDVRYSIVQAAERARVPPAWVSRFWRALGFPDVGAEDIVFTDADVDALSIIAAFVELGRCSFDQALQMTRVLASSMARIAE